MEEPSEEWEITEEHGSGDSKMSSIFNTGWRVGKKIMITGVAISSAPVILPPLLVFSTLGFAFAVPFGLFFASYACTDKIMSKLLSRPIPSPLIMEDETLAFPDSEGYTEEENNGGEEMDMLEAEGKIEDEEIGKEMTTTGLIGDEKREDDEVEDVREEGQSHQDGSVRDEEKLAQEEVKPEEDVPRGVEKERIDEAPVEESVEEEEEPRRESNGVIEESRDVEGVNETIKEDEKPAKQKLGETQKEEEFTRETNEVMEGNEDEEQVDEALEETQGDKSFDKSQEEDKLIGETKGVSNEREGELNVEESMEEKTLEEETLHIEEETPTRVVKGTTIETKDGDGESGDSLMGLKGSEKSNIEEGGKPTEKTERVRDTSTDEKLGKDTNEETKSIEVTFDDSEKEEEFEGNGLGVAEKVRGKEKVEEIKQEGEDYVEPQQTNSEPSSAIEDHSFADMSEGSQDSVGNPVPKAAESKSAKGAPGNERTVSSREVVYSEEKTWEQIYALRKIVGYKAAPQVALMEEVKALYVFTGVKPPSDFKDPSDLVEVNNKLGLLMSIVGVK